MKKLMLAVVMLAMVAVAVVPALAQDGEFDVVPAPEPVAPCDTGSLIPGEFVVYYYSEEEMWAGPQENVIDTRVYEPTTYFYYMQTLYFEDIANILDPCEMFAAQEAKRQEILAWPGVKIAAGNAYAPYVTPVPAAG